MQNINLPATTIAIVNANVAVENTPQKILFVAQKTSVGTATAGDLIEFIQNGGAEDSLFGRDGMLATLIRANKVRNQEVQVDAIALDDAAGTAATGTYTVTGTATEDGTLTIIVASERNHKFTVAVTDTDTATAIASAIVSAINADLNVPVTAASAVGVVTLTAVNAGTYGNSIPMEVRGTVGGITVAVVGMASGATDPTLTGVFDVIGERRYQAIVWGYPSDTVEVRALLDPRFNSSGIIQDGVAYTALFDTFANLTTLGDALNSQSLHIIGDQKETTSLYAGGAVVEIPMVKAAQTAGFISLRLDTSGFNIADIVIATDGLLDAFGGPHLASKPIFNTPYEDLAPIQTGRGFDKTEIEALRESGISIIGNNTTNNGVIAGEMVTTYKNDSAGNPDPTFTFLSFVHTASQSREFFQANLTKRFGQTRLTLGDVVSDHSMANEQTIKSFLKRLFQDLSSTGFVLLQAGSVALKFFEDNLVVSLDSATGKVTVQMVVPIVTQLRIINVTMQVAFSTSS